MMPVKWRNDVSGYGSSIRGGYRKADGGDGSQSAIAKAFDAWKQLMKINDISVFKDDPIIGFLIPFRETREVTFRHG